jgi:hypothetical protein
MMQLIQTQTISQNLVNEPAFFATACNHEFLALARHKTTGIYLCFDSFSSFTNEVIMA